MSGYNYSNLVTDIRNYSEVDSNVFTAAVINRFIGNAEYRIAYDLPMDSDRRQAQAQFATDTNSINVPAECLFVRGVQVFPSTANTNEQGQWLERRDQTFISEYVGNLTGPKGSTASLADRDWLAVDRDWETYRS